ncbi:Protein FRA10AC1 [Liparis tanakae]|uniref:Protein FRA10AC1 n=1 Tax=Liparis tanakae TaxID=230148 RepID=A0A4Z2GAT4_9TELE|nr:Protein FRA10AC1 [Liparis tanakae]
MTSRLRVTSPRRGSPCDVITQRRTSHFVNIREPETKVRELMDSLVKVHGGGGYDSDFSDDDGQGESSEKGLKRKHEEEILQKPFQKSRLSQKAHRSFHSNEVDRANDKTDSDVLRENHRFLWRDEDEEDMTWEKELAKKYYDKLFKEYCIADLSRYKENKVR